MLRIAVGERLVVYVRGPLTGGTQFGFVVEGMEGSRVVVGRGEVRKFVFSADERLVRGGRVKGRMMIYKAVVGGGVDGGQGVYMGLLGALIVYPRGHLLPNGRPSGVHTELVSIFWVANENKGGEEADEQESNLMHTINGRVFCSLRGLHMTEGEVTRWYLAAVGNEVSFFCIF